jgi:hypothetical protein
LHGDAPTRLSAGGPQAQRRRFVRDGEVPVTVIRRDHHPDGEHGANQLDAARQATRSEATAEAELAAEHLARCNAEDALAQAVEAHRETRVRLRDATAVPEARKPLQAPHGLLMDARNRQTSPAGLGTEATPDATDTARPTVPAIVRKRGIGAKARDTSTAKLYREQPASDGKHDSDIVEWWEPGWRKKLR